MAARRAKPCDVVLEVRNESDRKRMYQRRQLEDLVQQACDEAHPGKTVEVSVLFCDDPFIQDLNAQYRKKNEPTDVLSFAQECVVPEPLKVLGDIVISLETVERHCDGVASAMREEVRLLFCHGLLHLLGHVHRTADERETMQTKQAQYLGVELDAAWGAGPLRKQ